MRQVDKREGLTLSREYWCGECGGELIMAWHSELGHIIKCGLVEGHAGETKRRWAPMDQQPWYMQENMRRKRSDKLLEQYGEEAGRAVARYQGVTKLTQEAATDILQSFWPDAPANEVYRAAVMCATFGLNPLMGHLYLIPYWNKDKGRNDWVLTLGISTNRLLASRKGGASYIDGPRIMSEAEQIKYRGEYQPQVWWAICTIEDKNGQRATGLGKWNKADPVKGANKGNTGQNMAFTRAERQALNKKFPGEMPGDVEVMDDAYIEHRRAGSNGSAQIEGPAGDGEIIEGEARVLYTPSGDEVSASVAERIAKDFPAETTAPVADPVVTSTGAVEGEASTKPRMRGKSKAQAAPESKADDNPAEDASRPSAKVIHPDPADYINADDISTLMALGGYADTKEFHAAAVKRFDPDKNKGFRKVGQITRASAAAWIGDLKAIRDSIAKLDAEAEDRLEAPDIASTPPITPGPDDVIAESDALNDGPGPEDMAPADKPFQAKAGEVYHSETKIPRAKKVDKAVT